MLIIKLIPPGNIDNDMGIISNKPIVNVYVSDRYSFKFIFWLEIHSIVNIKKLIRNEIMKYPNFLNTVLFLNAAVKYYEL